MPKAVWFFRRTAKSELPLTLKPDLSITMVNCPLMSKSERARTPVVPNRNEFKNYHTFINRSF
ncbi:hypothetical protein FS559_07050 [Treponema phagedenis]|nr:hypothetical protein FS559_07050 [Treponema phagedenis]